MLSLIFQVSDLRVTHSTLFTYNYVYSFTTCSRRCRAYTSSQWAMCWGWCTSKRKQKKTWKRCCCRHMLPGASLCNGSWTLRIFIFFRRQPRGMCYAVKSPPIAATISALALYAAWTRCERNYGATTRTCPNGERCTAISTGGHSILILVVEKLYLHDVNIFS